MMALPQMRGVLAGGGSVDPFFSSVTLLYHFIGSNGGTTITDSSSKGHNGNVTASNKTTSTAQAKFGTTSLLSTASGGGTLSAVATANADFQFGTGDWTMEFFFRADSLQTATMLDLRTLSTQVVPDINMGNDGSLGLFVNNVEVIQSAASVYAATTWGFLACARASGTTRMWYGSGSTASMIGSAYTDSNNYNAGGRPFVASAFSSAAQFLGYMAEVRITKGVARYSGSGAITVPTAAFPNH